MINIGIRADGNSEIGMGHIIRCITLAKEFARSNNVIFISRYTDGINKIKSEGFKILELPEGLNLIEEQSEIKEAIKLNSLDLLVIDTYKVTEDYFIYIKQFIRKIVYLDDVNKFVYPVDILVNDNITGDCMNYKKYSESEILLIGIKYNLLRGEFENLRNPKINNRVKDIMLTTGGADPFNFSIEFIKFFVKIKEFEHIKLNIIVGNAFRNKSELRGYCINYKNVILHENVNSMSEIMLKTDLAISSGGCTLYELCACGIPTIAFIMADNQEFVVDKMSEMGYIDSLGWYNQKDENVWQKKINDLCFDYPKRQEMSKRMRQLVDGRGAERLVKEILDNISK